MTGRSRLIASLQGVVKRFGARAALDGIDLDVWEGEALTLLGPNGAGKTTAIRVVLGLRRPDAGTALLFVGSQMEVSGPGQGTERRAQAIARIDRLTNRQRQVLEWLVRGRRNKQIAAALGIGETTVKMHRADMLARLGCATSADAIRLGVEAGLAEG